MIDLRSDTVTLPTGSMMQAIAAAPLGDDVYGEDPTVNALEEHTASLLGKEAGLFVASGTMGNLCAMLAHCPRGVRVIVGDETHIYRYEAGGASVLGGLVLHPLRNDTDGGVSPSELAAALESPDDTHVAPAGMLALENTHNRCGGTVLTAARIAAYAELAHAQRVPVHVDGARLFNAAVALGVTARSLVASVDSVQVCFSKGLAAPAGSMLVGGAAFIHRARRARKMLGGGMRQAGVLAAACRVALDEMVARLAADHARARRLAAGIRDALEGRAYALDVPQTNMVFVRAQGEGAAVAGLVLALREHGVLVSAMDAARIRMVAHAGIGDADIERAIAAFRAAIASS
jgi:threonine aldolase